MSAMHLVAVAYVSQARPNLDSAAIDSLLMKARSSNANADVTGVLLFGDGKFFQYFEGSRDGVEEVYRRIRASNLHSDIVELTHGEISQRHFRRWFMGFQSSPSSMIQTLSHAQWENEKVWLEQDQAPSEGMKQLLAYLGDATTSS